MRGNGSAVAEGASYCLAAGITIPTLRVSKRLLWCFGRNPLDMWQERHIVTCPAYQPTSGGVLGAGRKRSPGNRNISNHYHSGHNDDAFFTIAFVITGRPSSDISSYRLMSAMGLLIATQRTGSHLCTGLTVLTITRCIKDEAISHAWAGHARLLLITTSS